MDRLPRQTLVMVTAMVITVVFVALIFFPSWVNTRIVGFTGDYSGGSLVVTEVYPGSPAEAGGLRTGDAVTVMAGRAVSDWHRMYAEDLGGYFDARRALAGQPADYLVRRGDERLTLSFSARELETREILEHFGVRLFLILCVFGLAVYVVASRSSEAGAFLSCLCFCFSILWFASDQPQWPGFSSALVRNLDASQTYFPDLVELFSLQLVMGTLLHISLIFPGHPALLKRHRWLPALGYLSAILVPLFVLAFGDRDLANRIVATYQPRIVTNSILILATTGLMVNGYRKSTSPSVRERSRWIVAAMIVVASTHLVFWNIPTILTGSALVASYNWLLLTVVLLPVALAMAFTNHELFGVRGVIRRRIKLLESMLSRQEQLLVRRDDNIRNMQLEIQGLHRELEQYEAREDPGRAGPVEGLRRLEERYPQIGEMRAERLIGVSPSWAAVFEQAVIASRGLGPVMIVGESGTGKTDVARLVHDLGDRREQTYRQISCAQFEHADPAFALGRLFGIGTGHGLQNVPREGKKGLLEECHGGTLLLDDFDRLPLNVQDLFLYPLEGRPFEPGIGSGPGRSVSVKFLFATNVEPEKLVAEGKFRNDVLARLVTRIDLPPLRDRLEDVPLLVQHFLTELAAEVGHEISVVSPKAMSLLCRSTYEQGNVRQLRADLQKAMSRAALEGDRTLRAGYLSRRHGSAAPQGPSAGAAGRNERPAEPRPADTGELTVLRRHGFHIAAAEEELGYSHKSKTLSNHLRGMCIQAMADADWDVDEASRALAGECGAAAAAKLRGKMGRYLSRIEQNARLGTESRLFNNLPATYHAALRQALDRFAGGGRDHLRP